MEETEQFDADTIKSKLIFVTAQLVYTLATLALASAAPAASLAVSEAGGYLGGAEPQPDPGVTDGDGVIVTRDHSVSDHTRPRGLLPLTVHAALHQRRGLAGLGGDLAVLDVDSNFVSTRVFIITAEQCTD